MPVLIGSHPPRRVGGLDLELEDGARVEDALPLEHEPGKGGGDQGGLQHAGFDVHGGDGRHWAGQERFRNVAAHFKLAGI